MSAQQVRIERVEQLSEDDLAGLCEAAHAAILDGGGFGWVSAPPPAAFRAHWRGILAAPERELFIARLGGRIGGSVQMIKPLAKNQAGGHAVKVSTMFVAPFVRRRGVARAMLQTLEGHARHHGFTVINLDVRETLHAAIRLYEGCGFERWGVQPKYARVEGRYLRGYFYSKDLEQTPGSQGLSETSSI